MGLIAVYITHENIEQARKVAAHLLEKRLVACANFFPIESEYWWHGSIESASEVVSIVKTTTQNWDKVRAEVEKIHPYDVPCVVRFDIDAGEPFKAWVESETV